MPTLTVEAFKKQIAERRLSLVYLLVGEDVKLVDRFVRDIESTIDPADSAFAVERFHAGDDGASPVDIVAASRGLPMLGDRRIVTVLRAERLLKPKRAAKAASLAEESDGDELGADEPADVTALEEYLAAPVVSTTLVFAATDVDRSRRLTKRLVEKAQVVECHGLSADSPAGRRDARAAAGGWLQDEIRRNGRSIDPDAARLLAGRSGNDITKLRGDVERLLLYIGSRKTISADDVREVVSEDDGVDDEWAVVNAISSGNAALALTETARRLERGDSVHALVGQLRWWVSNRLVEGDPHRVKDALDALLRADLALKSSGGDERVLVERLVIELTGKPLSAGGARRW